MLKNVVGALALTVFVLVAVNVIGDLAFPTPSPSSAVVEAPADEPEETAKAEPEAAAEPTAEVEAEPAPETAEAPAPEAMVEAAVEAAPEPVAEAVAEPVAEAAAEVAEVAAVTGDAASGKKIFRRKCMTCHTFEKGARNMTGPNLWGVVGRDKGKVEGFRYSDTLSLMGGTWSEDDIQTFIASPRKFVTDTKMAFPGLKKEQDRMDVLSFLKTLKD